MEMGNVYRRVAVRVRGIVQGVGFRPFIYRLARQHQIAGWVLNDTQGVKIEAAGTAAEVAAFLAGIRSEAPSMAVIDALEVQDLPVAPLPNVQDLPVTPLPTVQDLSAAPLFNAQESGAAAPVRFRILPSPAGEARNA